MTPEDMARIHAEAFAGQGRAWHSDEFADLLQSAHVVLCHSGEAFALGRVIADEAELLTIATSKSSRRQGLGRSVLRELEAYLHARGATRLFLEVAEDNAPALALYRASGFAQAGRRAGYYASEGLPPADALLLEKPLKLSAGD